jgi:hypothetical protein
MPMVAVYLAGYKSGTPYMSVTRAESRVLAFSRPRTRSRPSTFRRVRLWKTWSRSKAGTTSLYVADARVALARAGAGYRPVWIRQIRRGTDSLVTRPSRRARLLLLA